MQLTPVGKLITLIHEWLHAEHPDWSEDFIQDEELKLLKLCGIRHTDTVIS